MRGRIAAAAIILMATLVGCGGGGGSSNSAAGATRTVLTDFNLDEFASSYFGFFPRITQVHAGDSINFKQAWTGEPHTVTLGTAVAAASQAFGPFIKGSGRMSGDLGAVDAAEASLPGLFGEHDAVNQTMASPCYLNSGDIPTDNKPCPRRSQPAFTGHEALFNSGLIPYEGNDGNRFTMRLAADITAGDYFFYCVLHGPTMGGYLRVVAPQQKIEGQSAVNRRARAELDAATTRLRTAHRREREDAGAPADIVAGGFSAHDPSGLTLPFSTVNEFEPKTFRTKVGTKVTWVMPDGPGHTVSFHVPRYLPALEFTGDGAVLNPQADEPQSGPGYPRDHTGDAPAEVDAGNYDGSFFLSSGYPDGAMRYAITFTKPGTYDYACLLHPRMVAKVVVASP